VYAVGINDVYVSELYAIASDPHLYSTQLHLPVAIAVKQVQQDVLHKICEGRVYYVMLCMYLYKELLAAMWQAFIQL